MQKVTFLSLGGLEEIGLNCYVYGSESANSTNNYIIVDLGIGFRDSKFSFLDTFIPDISFFKKKNNKLNAIFFTHGHEDHIGAFEYYCKDLKDIPIYATPLTANLIRSKLKYHKISSISINEVKFYKHYKVSDFNVTFIPIEHSIPESAMLLIEIQGKTLLHSGDFKINTSTFNYNKIAKVIPNTVDYFFCDSTNADKDRLYEPEESILHDLNSIVKYAESYVWVTLFSSNIERLNNLINKVAKPNNRKVVLLGASVNNYYNIVSKYKYIVANNVITLEEATKYTSKEILYIVTGSQGDNNSFLLRLLKQSYKGLKIGCGDTVIFLSKPIPGNEVKVNQAYNLVISSGAKLYKHTEYKLHVSGHAYSKQIELLVTTIKPKFIIPIHGELLQLNALFNIAKSLNISSSIFKNGQVINLTNEQPQIVKEIPFNKLHYESGRILYLSDNIFKERKKAMYEGVVSASLIVEKNIISKDIKLDFIGLLTSLEREKYFPYLCNSILHLNKELSTKDIIDSETLKTKVKSSIKKFFKLLLGKKPITIVVVFYR